MGIAASRLTCNDAVELLQQVRERSLNITTQITHYQQRVEMANQYITAYRRYCWNVTDIGDLKL